jgi:murein L,D-transpeptidase YcbB/YkuD
MAVNGRLPDSDLRAIAGGRLAAAFAVRWNLANAAVRAHGLPTVMPNGSMSSYRTFAQQVFLRAEWCQRGQCQNAAVPGTSNHGWGRAVDTNRRSTIQQYGARYGVRFPTDAPWEGWHTLVHLDAIPAPAPPPLEATLHKGVRNGRSVRHLKRMLHQIPRKRQRGGVRYWRKTWPVTGSFGPTTVYAVKLFQRDHLIKADGVVGPATWHAIHKAIPHS